MISDFDRFPAASVATTLSLYVALNSVVVKVKPPPTRFGFKVFLRVVVRHTRKSPRRRQVRTLRLTLADSFVTAPVSSVAATLKLHLRLLVQERLESRATGRVVSRDATPGGGGGGAWLWGMVTGGAPSGAAPGGGVEPDPLSVSEAGALPSMNFRIAGLDVSV